MLLLAEDGVASAKQEGVDQSPADGSIEAPTVEYESDDDQGDWPRPSGGGDANELGVCEPATEESGIARQSDSAGSL